MFGKSKGQKKRGRSRRSRAASAEATLRRGMIVVAICAGAGMWGYAALNLATRAL